MLIGNSVKKGEQLDFGEFCINFMERVAEGLKLQEGTIDKLAKSNHLDALCGSVFLSKDGTINNYMEDKVVILLLPKVIKILE